MNTYYNAIYNGNIAIQNGILGVESNYQEDFWQVLPVERMQDAPSKKDIFDTNSPEEEAKNPDFKKAEEKATKAIQKHSMYIAGQEYNHQMDEAFLLLGKSRYYSHRYIQAKDAFSYIINHYPESSELVDAKIWTEKVNMRLKYYDLALKNLLKLKNEYPDLSPEKQTHLNSIFAEAHILNENYSEAINPLNKAIFYTKEDSQKGRLLYIKAQLFDKLNQIDSADYTFQKVIDLHRKSPRAYMIHARLEQIKNLNKAKTDYASIKEQYNILEENRENRPFLDFIYYDFAVYNNEVDSIDIAIQYYNKSLRRKPLDNYLYARNYLKLAQIYFDKNNYKTAGAYYDSTLTKIDKKEREYRQVAKKRENLEDVIKYEGIANQKDSVIALINMSNKERNSYFEKHILKLKEEAKSVFATKTSSQKVVKNNNNSNSLASLPVNKKNTRNTRGGATNTRNNNVSFYFYDTQQVQKGLLIFKQTWGEVLLTDNWKYEGSNNSVKDANGNEKQEDPFANDPRYKTETYISKIPTNQQTIDSIWIERNFAYYQLGVIYKEKFKEYKLSLKRFESLLQSNPEKRLILPSIYNLYLIAKAQNNSTEENKWRNIILNDYPESQYASLLINPTQFKNSKENPQNIYNNLYKSYENKQYNLVITQAEKYSKQLLGRPIVPKFELLKAYAIAKINGVEAYKKALNYVALTYPQSKEGKFAQKKYKELSKKISSNKFTPDSNNQNYKLVYYFEDEDQISTFKEQLEESFSELELNYKTTTEVYSTNQNFVVIHDLNSKLGAEGLAQILIKETEISLKYKYFAISKHNYNIIQIHKNLEDYLNL